MKIVDRKTALHNMGNTRTIQHFGTLVGDRAHKMGLVATLYPDLAITLLTEAIRNIYFQPKGSASNFQPINSMVIEWDIDVNYIKKVYFAESVTIAKPGLGKVPFQVVLDEKYFSKNDTFTLEDRRQLLVIAPPVQLGVKRWQHTVVLVGNDYSKSADPAYMRKGMFCRFRSNYHPELSERGYSKYHSNTERHRK